MASTNLCWLCFILMIVGSISCGLDLKDRETVEFRQNDSNETFVLFTQSLANFKQADVICNDFGQLADVRDTSDQMFLSSWLKDNFTWVGQVYNESAVSVQANISNSKYLIQQEPCRIESCWPVMNPQGELILVPRFYYARVLCKLDQSKSGLGRKVKLYSEKQVFVVRHNMTDDLQAKVIDTTVDVLSKYNGTKHRVMAYLICKNLQIPSNSNESWQCFLGESFTSIVTCIENSLIYFFLGPLEILLFRTQ